MWQFVEFFLICHPEPFAVILSEAKDLLFPLRTGSANNLLGLPGGEKKQILQPVKHHRASE
jgi:hypothetical protein